MSALDQLPMWVFTAHPTDFPDKFVARLNVWNEEVESYLPTATVVVRDTHDEVWDEMVQFRHLTFLPRDPNDEMHILGVFL